MPIRIMLVDDHNIVRKGLRLFLSRDHDLEIVGEAANGVEALEQARKLRPDVILMDLLMPVMDGITAITQIRKELPETEVVALTSVLEKALVVGAIRAGAIGYLLKDTDASELRKAIKTAAAHQVQLSPQASTYLLREIRVPDQPVNLTERELDVLRLLAQGRSNKEIAQQLYLVEDTVKAHVKHILSKLGVHSRTQAALYAIQIGLIPFESSNS